jgi:DNA-binding NtrC family response regulator
LRSKEGDVVRQIRRVLVVDDEQAVLDAARRSMPDCEVLVESDARVVEDRVWRDRPDLVVLDQWLNHDVHGHEVANAIKRRDPAQLVVLFSSGLDVAGMKYLLTRCAADDVFVKNITFDELLARIVGDAGPPEPDWKAVPTLDDLRGDLARRALARFSGNRSETARFLGHDRSTLKRWLGERGKTARTSSGDRNGTS